MNSLSFIAFFVLFGEVVEVGWIPGPGTGTPLTRNWQQMLKFAYLCSRPRLLDFIAFLVGEVAAGGYVVLGTGNTHYGIYYEKFVAN